MRAFDFITHLIGSYVPMHQLHFLSWTERARAFESLKFYVHSHIYFLAFSLFHCSSAKEAARRGDDHLQCAEMHTYISFYQINIFYRIIV